MTSTPTITFEEAQRLAFGHSVPTRPINARGDYRAIYIGGNHTLTVDHRMTGVAFRALLLNNTCQPVQCYQRNANARMGPVKRDVYDQAGESQVDTCNGGIGPQASKAPRPSMQGMPHS